MSQFLTAEKIQRKAKSLSYFRKSRTIYIPVSDNIYYDGKSYRVRVTHEAVRVSKNFKNIKEAIKFRDKTL
jgi:hypothetical protein